jgi:hypothetical protein
MLRTVLFTLCTSLLVASALGADVYKYKDEKGNIQYTDRPLTLPAERINIASQRTDYVELQERSNDDAKAAADREKAQQQADKAKTDQKKAAVTTAEGKAEACNKARQDYLSRMNAQRLFEQLPNGDRRYLESAEIDATRAAAKTAMDALCN